MSHFKRIKKRHFRTVKGWKKEVEEISIVFLLVILVVVGFSAHTARAQSLAGGKGIYFMGLVTAVLPCPVKTPATPLPTPCTTLHSEPNSPTFAVQMVGFPFLQLDFTMANLKDGSIPVPGGFVGGSAIPGLNIATDFYSY